MVQSAQLEAFDFAQMELDPYPTYARWRREAPVRWVPEMGAWWVTTWDGCETVGKAEELTDGFSELSEGYLGPSLLTMHGDLHRSIRASVDETLRPKAVRGYIEEIARPVAREYVERIRGLGRMDATTDFFELVSARVVGNVLGMGELDDATLQRWFTDMNAGLVNFVGDPDVSRRADIAKGESTDFARDILARLDGNPDGSAFSHLLLAETPDGQPRGLDQLLGTMWLLMIGGIQEPGHAAAATLLGLLENPDQYEAVRADLSLVPAAIHEGIRWIAPFGAVQRRALADLEVEGVTIPAGAEIHLVIGSANRDETRYEDPDSFDVFRERLPLASFGYGMHFCAGHFLARELEKVTFEELLVQLPGLRLDPDRAAVTRGHAVRGVKSLPVVWDV